MKYHPGNGTFHEAICNIKIMLIDNQWLPSIIIDTCHQIVSRQIQSIRTKIVQKKKRNNPLQLRSATGLGHEGARLPTCNSFWVDIWRCSRMSRWKAHHLYMTFYTIFWSRFISSSQIGTFAHGRWGQCTLPTRILRREFIVKRFVDCHGSIWLQSSIPERYQAWIITHPGRLTFHSCWHRSVVPE